MMFKGAIIKAFLSSGLTLLLFLNAFPFSKNRSVEKVNALKNVFDNYSGRHLLAEAMQLLNAKEHIKINLDKLSLQIYLSNIPQQENSYSLSNFQHQILLFTYLDNHQALANLYRTLAISNVLTEDFDTAKKWFLKALDQCEMLNHNKCVAVFAQNLSWLSFKENNLGKSLLFNQMAISALSKASNRQTLFEYLIWRNNIFLAQGNAKQVESQILNNILGKVSGSSKLKEWECYYQLGKSYLQQQKLVQAKWFFVQALTLSNGFNSKTPKIRSLLMLAKTKSKVKDYMLAIQDLKTAESLSKGNTKLFRIDVAKQMAAVYKAMGNRAKEKYYYLIYVELKEKLLN